MFKRIAFAVLLMGLAAHAGAVGYGDIWYNPSESGWGVNVVQSNNTQFLTFFVYGPSGQPTWYVATTTYDEGTGNYNGDLYAATSGTYYGAPWAGFQGGAVGTASFQPIDTYHAKLVFGLTGGSPVTKTIQRQTLTPYVLADDYSGSISGKVTGCADTAVNKPNLHARFNLVVTQVADASATLTFTFVDPTFNSMVCTLSGPLTHYGTLYQMTNAQYSCTGSGFSPGAVSATVDSFHSTGQGIEGRWTASTSGGCTQSIHFAAVL